MSKCDVCLRSERGVCPSCAPAEIDRLRAELETVKQERDEARRDAEAYMYPYGRCPSSERREKDD